MRKILTVIVTVIVLFVAYFVFYDQGGDKTGMAKYRSIQAGTLIGDSSSLNTVYLLSLSSSEEQAKIHLNFLGGLKDRIENAISNNSISISIISPTDLDNLLAQENSNFRGKLLVVPEGDLLESSLLTALHNKSLVTLIFSSQDGKTCIDKNQSPYIWNFGISPSMYAESYFSYANQRYGQLAKELTFVIYSNMDSVSENQSSYFKNVIEGLGFDVQASVRVDSREGDLYKVLRDIINFSPRILLASTNKNGVRAYVQQVHKLGFGFEMALLLSENIPEEVISDLGSSLDTFIKPSVYLDSLESDTMTAFKKDRSTGESITSSFYRGYLVSEVLDRILLRFKENKESINFSSALLGLDGNRINAPSGSVMIHSKARGLIQPLHIGEFKEGHFKYLQYLGDMSPSEQCS